MSVITRGIKNTFRNTLRTAGFSFIIAISLGLAFSMLLANRAVQERDKQLRNDLGASLIVQATQSTQNPDQPASLTDADAAKLAKLAHVREVIRVDAATIQNPNETKQNKEIQKKNSALNGKNNQFALSGGNTDKDPPPTNLVSAVDMTELKKHMVGPFEPSIPPIVVEGTTGNVDMQGVQIKPIKGRFLQPSDTNSVLIGHSLAKKNHLDVGSTFTIKDKPYKIIGIFNSGSQQADNRLIAPLETVRALNETKDTIPAIIINADSLENLDTVKQLINTTIGGKAVVRVLQPDAIKLAESLRSIETISIVTLFIALLAGTLTILLTMLLVVRERTKEIGILKALGATNTKVVSQFIVESTTLTLVGATFGMGLAGVASNLLLKALIAGNVTQSADPSDGMAAAIGSSDHSFTGTVQHLTTLVDWHLIVYGLAIALAVALLAAAVPAFLIAKVRPAQIMRGDS